MTSEQEQLIKEQCEQNSGTTDGYAQSPLRAFNQLERLKNEQKYCILNLAKITEKIQLIESQPLWVQDIILRTHE